MDIHTEVDVRRTEFHAFCLLFLSLTFHELYFLPLPAFSLTALLPVTNSISVSGVTSGSRGTANVSDLTMLYHKHSSMSLILDPHREIKIVSNKSLDPFKLLTFCAESFVFQFAIQKCKD